MNLHKASREYFVHQYKKLSIYIFNMVDRERGDFISAQASNWFKKKIPGVGLFQNQSLTTKVVC